MNFQRTRSDIHRPSAIVPADYELVTMDYIGPSDIFMEFKWERQQLKEHMAKTGGDFAEHEHGGTCHCCGATAFFVGHFYHAKTNSYITVGDICANKLELGSPRAFKTFRADVANRRKQAKGMSLASKELLSRDLGKAWDIYATEDRSGFQWEEKTIYDIVSKLVLYHSLSDKQYAFLKTLIERIPNRAAIQAEREAARAAAKPVPVVDGRIVVRGKLLKTRGEDTPFGFTVKMLVQHADGWKVWGTLPQSLGDAQVGDEIEFAASVTRSKDDEKFGFFSRPGGARILTKVS